MHHQWYCFFFQAEDGIRDLVRARGLGDVYKRQDHGAGVGRRILPIGRNYTQCHAHCGGYEQGKQRQLDGDRQSFHEHIGNRSPKACLLYTSDAAAERSSVDLGGRRIIKKKKHQKKKKQISTKQKTKQQPTAYGRTTTRIAIDRIGDHKKHNI